MLLTLCLLSATVCFAYKHPLTQPNTQLTFNTHLFDTQWERQEPLIGGLSGATLYTVWDQDGSRYVIRDISHKNAQRKREEMHAQKSASDTGYGPHLYASDFQNGTILMEFLEPQTQSHDPIAYAAQLGDLVSRIHNGPSFAHRKSIINRAHKLFEQLTVFPVDRETIGAMLAQFTENKKALKKPTHRDLTPNNIISTQHSIYTIDFERTAQDDPFFDLATALLFNCLNKQMEHAFLHAYYKRLPTQKEYERLFSMKKFTLIYFALVLLKKLPCQLVHDQPINMHFHQALAAFHAGELSLYDPHDLLVMIKSMFNYAIELNEKNN